MSAHARVVAVTGASAGVGRAVAVELASRGMAVALLARGEAGLYGATKEVIGRGRQALAVPVDVDVADADADADAVEAAAQRVEDELGPIEARNLSRAGGPASRRHEERPQDGDQHRDQGGRT